VPTFLWASKRHQVRFDPAGGGPEAAALHYLNLYTPLYRLPPSAIDAVYVHHVHDVGRGGVVVRLRQRIDGVEVILTEMKFLLGRDLSLVAIGGNLHTSSLPQDDQRWITVDEEKRALALAFADLFGQPAGNFEPRTTRNGWQYFTLRPAADSSFSLARPARIRPVYFPLPDRLWPAFQLELIGNERSGSDDHAYTYVIGAEDHRILFRQSLINDESYTYRVWADGTGLRTPFDGPHQDFTPHPSGEPTTARPHLVAADLVSIEGFNTNPDGMADPWLAPDATETRGNNVDAYVDLVWPQVFQQGLDARAPLTGPRAFDHPFDPALNPVENDAQRFAAVVQLFYLANWLHDYFYDSGFTEQAGNAQADNFDRGGAASDPLIARVEGKLTGLVNNARMMCPADGSSPEMRMGLWHDINYARVEALNWAWVAGTARFGATSFDVTAEVALVQDATAPFADGCESLTNDATIAGRIALLERGGCPFVDKVQRAEDASAVGVIVIHDTPGEDPGTMGSGNPPQPTNIGIGALMIPYEAGEQFLTALQSGPVPDECGPGRTGQLGSRTRMGPLPSPPTAALLHPPVRRPFRRVGRLHRASVSRPAGR
jgi:hypothetical protein